jgi:hypothetical protein
MVNRDLALRARQSEATAAFSSVKGKGIIRRLHRLRRFLSVVGRAKELTNCALTHDHFR